MPHPENDAVNVIIKEPMQMGNGKTQKVPHSSQRRQGAGITEPRIDETQEDKEEGGDVKSSHSHNYMEYTENAYERKE